MSFLHDLPIADLIAHYGYIAIFVIITLESAGLPLPGETVLLTPAACADSTGNINIVLVVAIAATARSWATMPATGSVAAGACRCSCARGI